MKSKLSILFVYEMPLDQEPYWKDGLFCALKILEKYFDIKKVNLSTDSEYIIGEADFILGHGGFGSKVDQYIQGKHIIRSYRHIPIGLCVAGNAKPCIGKENYSVLFCETEMIKKAYIKDHPNCRIAFGTNTDIFKPIKSPKIWQWTTVGAFSLWKNQEKLLGKKGNRLAVGYIQKDNTEESMKIISKLLAGGVMVSDMVSPETLAKIYNASENVGIWADIYGGGERAILESRACGINVEILDDNPKLKELVDKPFVDASGYALALLEGITSCLKQ